MAWPGAKAAAFRHIINLMPPHDVYIEPFLGDAAVMRAKRPARLNIGLDLDPESPGLAIGSRNGAGVLPGTASLPEARGPGASARLARGDRVSPESAALARYGEITWVMPREACHTGSGDPGSSGGNGAAAEYRFGCLDGIEFLRVYPFTGRELVYCDPPYMMSTRSGKRLYKHEMTDVDHRRFLRVAIDLPAMVMVSGYWSQLYADAFASWNSIHFQAMTRGGRPATEWLWFNFPVPSVLHDDRFLGEGFRARANLAKMKKRWVAKLKAMSQLQRQALLSAIADAVSNSSAGIDNSGD